MDTDCVAVLLHEVVSRASLEQVQELSSLSVWFKQSKLCALYHVT